MDKETIKKLKTLDISTTLFDNVAFVFFHVMETFSKDFFGSAWVEKSKVSELLLHELQQSYARNFEKKCKWLPKLILDHTP